MAVLDKGVKQRMIGALVLVALAVIFLPMLFTREDEMRQVRVDAPQAPSRPRHRRPQGPRALPSWTAAHACSMVRRPSP